MRQDSRRIALCGVLVALGVIVMALGGVLPDLTFVSPALAGLALLPVLYEFGPKWALAAYAAIALLSLMLSPDKESALLFAFLGYYPVLKVRLDRLKRRGARVLLKLAVFNAAAGLMFLCAVFLFNMGAILREYSEMSRAMLAAFVVLSNVTLLLYDRMLAVMLLLYHKRLRPILMKR